MPIYAALDTARVIGARAEVIRNRSLFVSRFPEFPEQADDKTARARTIRQLVQGSFDEGPACAARRTVLAAMPNAMTFTARLGARMMVNHAGGVIENAGLALDRHSGVPYIPGSTLKGIARIGAVLSGAKPEEVALVFGWANTQNPEPDLPHPKNLPATSFGGTVAFLPAFPTGTAPLERDIVTVHHQKYYRGDDMYPQAYDNEEPIPNEFPTIKAGAEFQFVVSLAAGARLGITRKDLGLPDAFDPLAKAREWLLAGLTDHGVGSKTAAGYGWFTTRSRDVPEGPGTPQTTSLSDYNERSFANLLRLAQDKGQWEGTLRKEIDTLCKPQNAEWLAKFKEETSGSDYKALRKKEWYPK